jgi:hypothetical protein
MPKKKHRVDGRLGSYIYRYAEDGDVIPEMGHLFRCVGDVDRDSFQVYFEGAPANLETAVGIVVNVKRLVQEFPYITNLCIALPTPPRTEKFLLTKSVRDRLARAVGWKK